MSTLRSLAALPAAGALLLLLTVIGGLLSRSTRAFSSRSRLLILALPVAVSLGAGIAALATPAASPAPAALALATSTIPASLAALALSQILGPRFGTLARAVVVALKAIAPPVLAAVLGSVEHSVVPPAVIASVTTAVAAALGTYQWAAGPRPAMQAAAMFIDENEKMRRACELIIVDGRSGVAVQLTCRAPRRDDTYAG
jgi:hypothetical protein